MPWFKLLALATISLFPTYFALAVETAKAKPGFQAPDRRTGTTDPTLVPQNDTGAADKAMQRLYAANSKNDYDAALKEVQALIDNGDAEAMFRLGRHFNVETGSPDYARALKLYQSAADKGHGRATNAIGLLYENGQGVPRDLKRAVELFELAAKRGSHHGYTNLARFYFQGLGVPKDSTAAFKWLEEGMAKGLAPVYHSAGNVYYFGEYQIPKNYPKALEYFDKAAQLGDLEAGWTVARMYLYGEGIPQNTQLGISKMEALAAQKHPPAFNSLGYAYNSGKGVAVDKAKAFDYYMKGAELGDCGAMRNVSASYQTGDGVSVDDVKAAQYLEMAVACSNPPEGEDLEKVATFYRDGRGVERDCERAVQLLQGAAQLGHFPALVDIGHIYEKGCGPIQADPNTGFKLYLMAAKAGDPRGQNNVGAMLKHGVNGGQPERVKAYAWLTLAQQNGDAIAKRNIEDFAAMFSDDDRNKAKAHLEVIKAMLLKPNQNPMEVWKDESY